MRTLLIIYLPLIFLGVLSCANTAEPDTFRQAAKNISAAKQNEAEKIQGLEKSNSNKPVVFRKDETPTPSQTHQRKNIDLLVAPEKKNSEPKRSGVVKQESPAPAKPLFSNSQEKIVKMIPDHTAWDYLLRTFVSDAGKVNYPGIKSKKQFLNNYLKDLKNKLPQKGWSRNERLAYWINAYNAFTIKMILDNYPVSSITDLHGGKPWDVKWIELGGKTYSLDNIENDILRPKFKEPRIHFAVNCAANSCPPLLNKAWTPNSLENYFEQQAIAFINNPMFNKISSNKVQISKIFEWYAGDFGNLIAFLNKYSKTKINANALVAYMDYDWSLNKK